MMVALSRSVRSGRGGLSRRRRAVGGGGGSLVESETL